MDNINLQDISLIPRVLSTIKSRDEINVSTKLGDEELSFGLYCSPMVDSADWILLDSLRRLGGMGCLHRFCSIERQILEFNKCKCDCAIGVNGDYKERFQELVKAGCKRFIVDVANGFSSKVGEVINELYLLNSEVKFIAGNIASWEGYLYLAELPNVVGIRLNIGSSKVCRTTHATGISYGSFSLLKDITGNRYYSSIRKNWPAIIIDGGINEVGDYCKALAFGADLVMTGREFARCVGSPAKIVDGKKLYRGSASFEIQELYKTTPRYIEGTSTLLDYNDNDTLENLVNRYNEGLRSSMSYFNARNLTEYRQNISFI